MHSERAPRQHLGPWLPYARRNGTAGRTRQTIRQASVQTLRTIRFDTCELNNWMTKARDKQKWSKRIKNFLGLKKVPIVEKMGRNNLNLFANCVQKLRYKSLARSGRDSYYYYHISIKLMIYSIWCVLVRIRIFGRTILEGINEIFSY